MAPDIAKLVTCSVAGHTFGQLVDEHNRRLCVECGTVETPTADDDEPTDPDPTELWVDNGGESGS